METEPAALQPTLLVMENVGTDEVYIIPQLSNCGAVPAIALDEETFSDNSLRATICDGACTDHESPFQGLCDACWGNYRTLSPDEPFEVEWDGGAWRGRNGCFVREALVDDSVVTVSFNWFVPSGQGGAGGAIPPALLNSSPPTGSMTVAVPIGAYQEVRVLITGNEAEIVTVARQ